MTENQALVIVALIPLVIVFLCFVDWPMWPRVPPPRVGQVWRSEYSGRLIRITQARIGDRGQLLWAYQLQHGDGWNPLSMSGEGGLRGWRCMVREERRVLVDPPDRWNPNSSIAPIRQSHVPPRPLPAPAPPTDY